MTSTVPPPEPILTVTKARGSLITLEDGRVLVDAATRNAILGLSPTLIQLGIESQAARLPHAFDEVLTAAPAAKLAGRLNGLIAGKRGTLAASPLLAADTAFAMARKAKPGMIASFEGNAFTGDGAPLPLPRDAKAAAALETALQARSGGISAVVIEPLVQLGPGMAFHSEDTLTRVAEAAARYDVALIVDERFSGFGRLGVMFAYQAAGIDPDLVILGGMLTGGTLPIGAVLADQRFATEPSGAPDTITAAAANAFLDLYARENRLLAANETGKKLAVELGRCLKLPCVKDLRVRGALAVIELAELSDAAGLKRQLRMDGVLAATSGNTLVLTPALTIVAKELHKLSGAVFKVLKQLG